MSALEAALRTFGDASPGDAAFAVDGFLPTIALAPRTVDELAAALAVANEHSAAVFPWGAGRHMALGNIPTRYDIALRTTSLDRVIEYEAADLTITLEGGITIGKLQSLLAQHGQFLPIDAPSEATVGGVLAANVSGPSRHAYGLPRDWLIGCRVAHVDGTISKGGGRVVKNVAGYDMPKLYVGSLGTLGVIVEATFKLAPLPASQETLLAPCRSLDAAAELVFAADDRGLALRAVALDGATAAFWLAGPRAAVERSATELTALSHGAEARRLEGEASERWWAALATPAGDGVALKASLPPSDVAGFMTALSTLCREGSLEEVSVAYLTTGLVLSTLHGGDTEALVRVIEEARRAAVAADGSLVVTSAPLEVKQRVDVWGDAGSALPLMQRLKQEFDPKATLNPGRFLRGVP